MLGSLEFWKLLFVFDFTYGGVESGLEIQAGSQSPQLLQLPPQLGKGKMPPVTFGRVMARTGHLPVCGFRLVF